MRSDGVSSTEPRVVDAERRCIDPYAGLQALLEVLSNDGYRVVGPVVRDGVIAYDDIHDQGDLPSGCTVEQAPGRWRLTQGAEGAEGAEGAQGDSRARFSWTPGSESWKQFVFPARDEVLRVRRTDGSWTVSHPEPPDRPLAVIGARDCELRALDILDRVMLDPDHPDRRYSARRANMFVVAVVCGRPSATCWCTSMGGGPEPLVGFDLKLTELSADGASGGHRLLVEAATERGRQVLAQLPTDASTEADAPAVRAVVAQAVELMPVRVPGTELPHLLAGLDQHPHWDVVAERCLSCGNCTMVCPTCFCSTFTDHTPLGTDDAVRAQSWASCFELEHSNLGGRPVRATTAARYRQWLMHKLQAWPEQFDMPGCVGCGRCTTWCPAGIDIVAEANALLAQVNATVANLNELVGGTE